MCYLRILYDCAQVKCHRMIIYTEPGRGEISECNCLEFECTLIQKLRMVASLEERLCS